MKSRALQNRIVEYQDNRSNQIELKFQTFAEISKHPKASKSTKCTHHDHMDIIRYNLILLRRKGWYWGPISPSFAAQLLEDQEDGTFLIRDSSNRCYIFSITYKLDGEIHHTRIEHSNGEFSFCKNPRYFQSTVVDLVEKSVEYCHSGDLLYFLHGDPERAGPIRFQMRPLSRRQCGSSLKHLCRFAILPYVSDRSNISKLPLPQVLIEYLGEPFRQFDPVEGM